MAAQNIIELGFNIEQLTAEKKQVLDLFVDMFGQLEKYDGTRFNPLGGGGLADLKKSISEGGQALAAFNETAKQYNETVTEQARRQSASKQSATDLTAVMKEYQKIIDQLTTAQAKNNAANSDAAEGLAAEREALKQRNAELAAGAKMQLSEAGSINEAKAAVAQLTIERNKQNTETDEGREKIAELNAEIDKNNELIRHNSDAMGQRKINIGNYAESLSPAFATVSEQLESINAQMSALEQKAQNSNNGRTVVSGFAANQHLNQGPSALAGGASTSAPVLAEDADGYAKLAVQAKIYQNLQDRQIIGFKTSNEEMRAVKNTLDALVIAGAENTETFEKLNNAYTETEQKVKDLHREQTILTGDAPAITALTGVAKGLGGVYAIGASAASAFADGNEKVEKELNKLVAVMTFLQGLEEATAALKDRNAIATALETEATKALNFVKAIEVRLFGESKVAAAAESAAQIENTEVTAGATAAAEANTAAVEAETVASEAATEATIGLRTAWLSVGIGAAIIAVGVLAAKIVEWSEAENRAAENSAELAEAMEKVNEILEERIRLSDEDADHTKKNLANAQELAEKNKQAYDDIYSIKKATADLDLATAQNDLKKAANTQDLGEAYRTIDGQVKSLTGNLDPLLKKQEQLVDIGNIWQAVQRGTINQSEAYLQIYQKYGTNTTAEDAKTQLDSVQKQVDATKKVIEDKKKLTDAYNQSQVNAEALAIEKIQHDADEQRKITLATATTEADAVKAKNQIILNDDRSTLDQRLAAIRSNAQQEKDIIQAGLNDQLARPDARDRSGVLTADSKDAIQKTAEERQKITESSEAEIYKTIVEWNDKKLQFLNDISKNQLESDAATQKAISDNDTKELSVRLSALYKSIRDRSQAISGDYALRLKLAIEHNKTQEEFDKIESDREKARVELNANVEKEIYDTVVSWGEKRLQAIEEQGKGQNSVSGVTNRYNAQSDALDKSLATDFISIFTYDQKRRKLDEQYAIDSAKAQLKDDEAKLQELKDYQEKYIDIQSAFAHNQLDIAKSSGDSDKIAKAQAEVDGITKVQAEGAAAITALSKKVADDQTAVNNAQNKQNVDAATALKNNLTKLASETVSATIQLYDDAHEKRIQNIEHITALQDAATQTEIANVQRSTLTSRQQAEEVAILSAQQKARDVAAQKEEHNEKVAEAKFDRDLAVAQAVWNTASGILKTFAEYGFSPVGIAAAAALSAIGAVEVAEIESKPLPAYAEGIGIPGKGEHPGGLARVGEGKYPERVTMPGRKPFIVDRDTLIDLPAKSIVEPLNENMVMELGAPGMMQSFAIINAHGHADNGVERAIDRQTARLERAIKRSNTRLVNKIIIPSETGGMPREYFESRILGRKWK